MLISMPDTAIACAGYSASVQKIHFCTICSICIQIHHADSTLDQVWNGFFESNLISESAINLGSVRCAGDGCLKASSFSMGVFGHSGHLLHSLSLLPPHHSFQPLGTDRPQSLNAMPGCGDVVMW